MSNRSPRHGERGQIRKIESQKQYQAAGRRFEDIVDEIVYASVEDALRVHGAFGYSLPPPATPYITPSDTTIKSSGFIMPSIEAVLDHPVLPQSVYENLRSSGDRVVQVVERQPTQKRVRFAPRPEPIEDDCWYDDSDYGMGKRLTTIMEHPDEDLAMA